MHAALGELALEEFELSAAQAACDRALEINPQFLAAWHLKADIHLANFEPRQCVGVLTDALKLHPHLGSRPWAGWPRPIVAIDGLSRTAADTRFGKLVAEVTQRNPHAGRVLRVAGRRARPPAALAGGGHVLSGGHDAQMPQLDRARAANWA